MILYYKRKIKKEEIFKLRTENLVDTRISKHRFKIDGDFRLWEQGVACYNGKIVVDYICEDND